VSDFPGRLKKEDVHVVCGPPKEMMIDAIGRKDLGLLTLV
jgi:hypothetical protein